MQEGQISLQGWKKHWGKGPSLEKLVFRALPGALERTLALLNKEVDLITPVPFDRRRKLEAYSNIRILERPTPMCVIVMYNAQSGPCADRRVRRALNYATDVDEIIARVIPGCAGRLNGPLSRHHSGSDPDLAPYPYDPDTARRLLAEAGYADGLTLMIDRPTFSPDESPELAENLHGQWGRVGVNLLERVHGNREEYAGLVREKQIADMCIFDSSPMSTYRVLREKLNSKIAGPWWQGYHNSQVNTLMEQAWATPDELARTRLYRQVTSQVGEDAPWLFLYNPLELWAACNTVLERLPGLESRLDGLVLL
jgi:peptide/nickel transport system substrate-binding protein